MRCRLFEGPVTPLTGSHVTRPATTTEGKLPTADFLPTAHTEEGWLKPVTSEVYPCLRRVRAMVTTAGWTKRELLLLVFYYSSHMNLLVI